MNESESNICKYCNDKVERIITEALECSKCLHKVHLNCLKKGAVPGGLKGDVFFLFTCYMCSDNGTEVFIREKMPW